MEKKKKGLYSKRVYFITVLHEQWVCLCIPRHIHCSCSTVMHIAMYTSIQTCLRTFSTIPICHYFLQFTCIVRSSTCVCISTNIHVSYRLAANFRQSHKHCQSTVCILYRTAASAEITSKRAMEVFTITPASSSTPPSPSPSSLILSQQGAGIKLVH